MLVRSRGFDLARREGSHRDRRNAEPESLEIRDTARARYDRVVLALRRRHVIEEAAVLVEVEDEDHAPPLRRVLIAL